MPGIDGIIRHYYLPNQDEKWVKITLDITKNSKNIKNVLTVGSPFYGWIVKGDNPQFYVESIDSDLTAIISQSYAAWLVKEGKKDILDYMMINEKKNEYSLEEFLKIQDTFENFVKETKITQNTSEAFEIYCSSNISLGPSNEKIRKGGWFNKKALEEMESINIDKKIYVDNSCVTHTDMNYNIINQDSLTKQPDKIIYKDVLNYNPGVKFDFVLTNTVIMFNGTNNTKKFFNKFCQITNKDGIIELTYLNEGEAKKEMLNLAKENGFKEIKIKKKPAGYIHHSCGHEKLVMGKNVFLLQKFEK